MLKITTQVFLHLEAWCDDHNPSALTNERLRKLMLEYLRSLPDDKAEHLITEGWPRVYDAMPKPDPNEKIKAHIIRTDGTEEDVEVSRATPFDELYGILGAETFDTVNLAPTQKDDTIRRVMLVDDNGYVCRAVTKGNVTQLIPTAARKPVNEKATKLYEEKCRSRGGSSGGHKIVGDVAIVNDDDFD